MAGPPPEPLTVLPDRDPEPPPAGGGGGVMEAGTLTQLGAGSEVSLEVAPEKCVFPAVEVWTATTRMSPAGMPCA